MGIFTIYCGKEFRTVLDLEDRINKAHKEAGKTLIGTCGDCEFWQDGLCGNLPEWWDDDCDKFSYACIAWKEKQND